MNHFTKKVHWWPTGDTPRPWGVWHEGVHWEVFVVEAPGEHRRYALFIDGVKQEEFVDWPPSWTKANGAGSASQRAEFEHEEEYWEKNRDVLPLDDDFGDED